jgi:ribosome-binding ATPase YchF (GTP1/OBG family)
MVKETWKGLQLLQKSTIREIGILCTCSDHGQPRYQVWIKCNKRQMTSCVHKMCIRTYGQTNMKRAITLAKINHPWNRYIMHMLRSWPTKIPNMNKMRQKTSCIHKMCRQTYGQTNMKRAITLAKINHLWNRYNMRLLRSWPTKIPNMNKMRQKTSCIHKMCRQTYGQTNMKRAITLAKINHLWNRYNMRLLRSWPTKIPNMNKIQQKTND